MATIVEGKVKEFGEAPYQHDEKINKVTLYVSIRRRVSVSYGH